jgi:cell wall-associated NlpC family hydrolase
MSSPLHRILSALALGAVAVALSGALDAGAFLGTSSEPAGAANAQHPNPAAKRHVVRRVVPKPTRGERAAAFALKAVGVPYRWGGTSLSGGFDCSGLVYWAYGRIGVTVPHNSYALYEIGRRVARSHLEPGDVLIFSGLGHVGLYLGHGRMVHAPQSGRSVEVVRLWGSHYGSRLVAARRIARA